MNLFVVNAWLVAKLAKDERGASMVEYAFLVALIAAVCIASVGFFGGRVDALYVGPGTSLS